ncbi:hypothetical protein, partial [Oscillatoria sp. HE19RPO]|uniref:hypothetical protein n=1 Tax=Oscillatoria sp. HE19RPO TaxID=2954806 RepID=UPI0020C3A401
MWSSLIEFILGTGDRSQRGYMTSLFWVIEFILWTGDRSKRGYIFSHFGSLNLSYGQAIARSAATFFHILG